MGKVVPATMSAEDCYKVLIMIFNLVIEDRMEGPVSHWTRDAKGLPLLDFDDEPTGYLTHVVWADNIWLLSTSIPDVLDMFHELTASLHQVGFEWKSGALEILTNINKPTANPVEVLSAMGAHSIPIVDHMNCLGTVLPSDGGSWAAIEAPVRVCGQGLLCVPEIAEGEVRPST